MTLWLRAARERPLPLSRVVLEPLAAYLGGCVQLGIIPQGAQWYVPWDSLPLDGQPLARTMSVTLGPPRLGRLPSPFSLTALGNVAGANLPGTAKELEVLKQAVPGARLLSGRDANRRELAEAATRCDVLHLASHAVVRENRLEESHVLLSDGPLKLRDAFDVKLKPGALVVLDCCETVRGESDPGREVSSLAQTFAAAGAAQVLATLWPVDDSAAVAVMRAFYGHLAAGLAVPEALRQAKLDCLESAPNDWATYVLIQS